MMSAFFFRLRRFRSDERGQAMPVLALAMVAPGGHVRHRRGRGPLPVCPPAIAGCDGRGGDGRGGNAAGQHGDLDRHRLQRGVREAECAP